MSLSDLDVGFYRSALENSSDCITLIDAADRVVWFNKAVIDAFGIANPDRLIGQVWGSTWPEASATALRRALAAARRGESLRFEGLLPARGGVETWWSVHVAPARDGQGAFIGVIVTGRDITAARKESARLQETATAEARAVAALRSVHRVAQVGSWEIDFTNGTTFFSEELCALLGQPPLPTMTIDDAMQFWCEEDRSRFQLCMDHVRASGQRMAFEGRSAEADGAVRWWRLVGEPEFKGRRVTAIHGAAQEITQWLEAQARETNALRAADAMSGFLATMSHELRTPLNGVLGMAQAMARGKLSAEQRERLGVIQASGSALLSLLNDLLDLSRIEAGKVEFEDGVIDTQVLAGGARSLFEALVDERDLTLEIVIGRGAEGHWSGDPNRVRQVLANLVSNAVKFTAHGVVRVGIARTRGGLELTVSDTGVGIPADRLDTIFDRFVQADASTTRRYGGSGLGLTICRDLVTMMGGKIGVESRPGAGATFKVFLPSSPVTLAEAVHEPGASEAPACADTGLRVLAAEDNPVNQLVLKTLLAEFGVDPVIVANGAEAVEAWRDQPFDLVLMDIQMPVMDGVAAVRRMREVERLEGRRRTPVIALTANAMNHHKAEYLAAGMDALVAKPITLSELLQTMDDVLAGGSEELAA